MGYCSRSAAQKLVEQGLVSLNGRVVTDPGTPFKSGKDVISIQGQTIRSAQKVYLMLNKPRGLVTTASDEQARETIYCLLPENRQWLAPVGRLDKASEGLLFLTNDSAWASRVSSPETHLDKTYQVQLAAKADDALLRRLMAGVTTPEGDFLKAKSVKIVRHGEKNSWVEIVLDEGKNRHIRRMCDALGIEVKRLVRIAIGPVKLGDLPKRAVRELTRQEKRAIDRWMSEQRQDQPRAE
jgi:23S rRNA pseudouridine2605 synthase